MKHAQIFRKNIEMLASRESESESIESEMNVSPSTGELCELCASGVDSLSPICSLRPQLHNYDDNNNCSNNNNDNDNNCSNNTVNVMAYNNRRRHYLQQNVNPRRNYENCKISLLPSTNTCNIGNMRGEILKNINNNTG